MSSRGVSAFPSASSLSIDDALLARIRGLPEELKDMIMERMLNTELDPRRSTSASFLRRGTAPIQMCLNTATRRTTIDEYLGWYPGLHTIQLWYQSLASGELSIFGIVHLSTRYDLYAFMSTLW